MNNENRKEETSRQRSSPTRRGLEFERKPRETRTRHPS